MHFERPRWLYANQQAARCTTRRKPGDITVVLSVKGEEFLAVQEDCRVANRERQHDVTVAGWCYRARQMEQAAARRLSLAEACCLRADALFLCFRGVVGALRGAVEV